MEQAQPSDLDSQFIPGSQVQVPQWFWQSDPDPWEEKDPTKWKWEPYSHDDCYSVEKALFLNESIVDLGRYEIDLKKMLQVYKQDRHKVRRVKREIKKEEESRFMLELPKPSIILEKDQKTINGAFGNVHHFLSYIMKRTPEAYRLFNRLKELKISCKEDEYRDIKEEVILCLKTAAETREKVVKTRALSSSPTNYIFEAKLIVDEIDSQSRDLRDFLQLILKIYTRESFVCYWLNELLRSENWEELNVLTPYLVCLTYTFQLQDYVIKYEKPKSIMESFFQVIDKKTLVLYRGTALTEDHLECYDPKKTKYFSWNGVSSTSRSKKQAKEFINYSLKKGIQLKQSKVGVLFTIETQFSSPEDCEGILDISSYSKYPHEQEVILPPGTVFKLISNKLNKENIYEINLKLKKKFKENQKDVSLLGDLQNKVISENIAYLDSLSQDEIIKILPLIEGNQLIMEFQMKNCKEVDDHLMKLIGNTLKTTKIKNLSLKFYSNNKISDEGIRSLSEGLKHLTSLQILTLYFNLCVKISDEGMRSLSEGLKHLPSLQILQLDTGECERITNEGFKFLSEGCKHLSSLQTLNLNFDRDRQISDEEIRSLSEGLRHLTSLQNLTLSFPKCEQISDEGIRSLSEGFKHLSSLQTLNLNFNWCKQINDEWIRSLSEGLKHLPSLQNLTLVFEWCVKISDEGMRSLSEGLKHLSSLRNLRLNLENCSQISDKGIRSLSKGLRHLSSLQKLTLNLRENENITNKTITPFKQEFPHTNIAIIGKFK